jgi:hypothetical protein
MIFEENKTVSRMGEVLGFTAAYFVFTTILFFILSTLHKLPPSWSYVHVMGIILIITVIGGVFKKLLK